MTNAGYTDSQYTIAIQTYASPLAGSTTYRYAETGPRNSKGGCGLWNKDLDWANGTGMPTMNRTVQDAIVATGATNIRTLDVTNALVGRRLCENTVGLLEEKGLSSWTASGAVDRTEWAQQIHTVSAIFGAYDSAEGMHPNYWGQLAIRNCVRQAFNAGAVKGGTCTRTANGLNAMGEPNMTLA